MRCVLTIAALPVILMLLVGCGSTHTATTSAAATTTPAAATTTATTTMPDAATTSVAKPPATRSDTHVGAAHAKHTKARVAQELSTLANAKPQRKLTHAQLAQLPVADITLTSPAIKPTVGGVSVLSGEYTCHGTDQSPPLRWSAVPPNTVELVLFVISADPVNDKLFFNWAIADISPSTNVLQAGRVLPGTIVGRNGYGKDGYSICPPHGGSENYVFSLYALPTTLKPAAGFNPATLRKEAQQTARHTALLVATTGS
jgi:phosphatidylethanolamine-binding protein (PEBP) family uncharacterized protein